MILGFLKLIWMFLGFFKIYMDVFGIFEIDMDVRSIECNKRGDSIAKDAPLSDCHLEVSKQGNPMEKSRIKW